MTGWRISFPPGYPRWIEAMDPMDPNHHGKTSSSLALYFSGLFTTNSPRRQGTTHFLEKIHGLLWASCNDRPNKGPSIHLEKMLNMFNLTKTPLCCVHKLSHAEPFCSEHSKVDQHGTFSTQLPQRQKREAKLKGCYNEGCCKNACKCLRFSSSKYKRPSQNLLFSDL